MCGKLAGFGADLLEHKLAMVAPREFAFIAPSIRTDAIGACIAEAERIQEF